MRYTFSQRIEIYENYSDEMSLRMVLMVDVDYRNSEAYIAGVVFENWSDIEESAIYKSKINDIEEYEPGKFYRRELPCILKLIQEHNLKPDTIVIDGFVWLDGEFKPGLGAYLYYALDCKVPIIGVAKKSFADISSKFKLLRGKSKKPLFITCSGIEIEEAIANIKIMYGENRIPILLKKADQLCRRR